MDAKRRSSITKMAGLLAIPLMGGCTVFQGKNMGEKIRIQVPEDHYTLFDVMRAEKPEVLVVNDALRTFQHRDVFPWHLRITIEAKDLIENGMPSPDESKLLFAIGDEIEEAVLAGRTEHDSRNAVFLARSTWNGIRELDYQVHNPKITHQVLQQLLSSKKCERPWEYRMQADADWHVAQKMFQLFPSEN